MVMVRDANNAKIVLIYRKLNLIDLYICSNL